MKVRTEKSHNETLSSGTFWAAMMVVGLHSYNAGNDALGLERGIIAAISHGLFTAAVPFFFVVSGYLFYKNASTYNDVRRKLMSRIRSLLMPYLAWGGVYYAVWCVLDYLGLTSASVNISVEGAIKAVAFHQFYFPMWFMFSLMVFTVLTALWLPICRKFKCLVCIVLLTFVYLGVTNYKLSFIVDNEQFVYFHANFYVYYLLGCLSGIYPSLLVGLKKGVLKFPIWGWLVLFCAFGVCEGLLYDSFFHMPNKRLLVPFVVISYMGLMVRISQSCISIWYPKSVSPMVVYGIHGLTGLVVGLIISRTGLPMIPSFFLGFVSNAILASLTARLISYCPPPALYT